jgi:hypothetical protein
VQFGHTSEKLVGGTCHQKLRAGTSKRPLFPQFAVSAGRCRRRTTGFVSPAADLRALLTEQLEILDSASVFQLCDIYYMRYKDRPWDSPRAMMREGLRIAKSRGFPWLSDFVRFVCRQAY